MRSLAACVILGTGCTAVSTGSTQFADTVVAAPGSDPELPFSDPALAANGARGAGCCAGSQDVYSLDNDGPRTELILSWSGGKILEQDGDDLVVFENPFEIGDGNVFMDLVIVGVSANGTDFVDFPHEYLGEDPSVYQPDPELWQGFAGKTPTLLNEDDEDPIPPLDPEAGGDRFDFVDLPDSPITTDIFTHGATHVRLRPAAGFSATSGQTPYPADSISNGPDIDAVYAYATNP